jgi:hypothetical protein
LNENTSPDTHVVVLGIDWSESHRIESIRKNYGDYETEFPLMEAPLLSKRQMIDLASARGVAPPRLYALGFAHNNCGGGCVRAGQGQFRQLLTLMPERYAVWEENERELRGSLGDVSILREQVNGIRQNLTLEELRLRDESTIDMFDVGGCGCFVEAGALTT